MFFFKQKTAYEMRISDWSSDVCSSDRLLRRPQPRGSDRALSSRPEGRRRSAGARHPEPSPQSINPQSVESTGVDIMTLRRAAIVSPLRTAVGKFCGGLSALTAGQLGATIIKALAERSGIAPERADDVGFGQGHPHGAAPRTGSWDW